MDDPQAFMDSLCGRRIVLDEIHRLDNPSQLLKIAADNYGRQELAGMEQEGPDDGERRSKTFVATNCDRLCQFIHLGR